MPTSSKGFSLVELSIVLVILGLLVGGILSGQSLIRASQLRSIIVDRDKFITGISTFREKYSALPGDMMNATTYWPAAHATNATCMSTARSGGTTCNGDGGGTINSAAGYEDLLAWEHLSLAGLVEGNLIGWATGLTTTTTLPGVTNPVSKITGGGWNIQYGTTYGGAWVGPIYRHNLVLAGFPTGANMTDAGNAGLLPAEDASNIDSKVDDGKPGTGSIRNHLTVATTCTTGASTTSEYTLATYNISAGTAVCSLTMQLGY